MDRYVNKDEALKAVSFDTEAYTAINMLHTVEVVKCKDCKHYDDGLCRRWKYSHVTSEESFCSGAERSEDE